MKSNAPALAAFLLATATLWCTGARAAVSYVQGVAATFAGPEILATVPFPSSQEGGDLNVVFFAWADTTANVVSVTDTSGNLYLRAHSIARKGVATQVVYYTSDIVRAGAGRNTITVRFSASVEKLNIRIAEYHGIDTARPLEVADGADGESAIVSSDWTAISRADVLLVASAYTAQGILGPGAGYTQRLIRPDSSILEDNFLEAAGIYRATALQVSAGWYLVQLVAFRAAHAASVTPPYPQSQLIAGMKWDFSTVLSHRKAIGSDIWPTTWAADGNIYAAWGDGGGFDGTERSKATGRTSLGFARIRGVPEVAEPDSFGGRNVWGQAPGFAEFQATFGGKVVDVISVDGVLYAQGGLWTGANCSCPDPTLRSEDNPTQRTLAWSADLGKNWQVAPWVSATDLGSSLQFGQDYAGAFDPAHVYFYYQRDVKTDPTHIYLRRVRRDALTENPATFGHFEYFAGTDEAAASRWSTAEAEATAVFFDPNTPGGVFAGPSVVYDAPLGRYLLAAWHGVATGQVGFFEGRTPWGPWTTVAYYENWGGFNETAGEATGLNLPAKWISADGRTLWAVFSGINNGAANEFDSLNVAKVILQ
jgi:hypothetical protein